VSKESVGDKFDKDKNRLDLIPAEAIEAAGWILTHGAKKYAERNWQKGIKYGKIYGALQRHLQAFWRGEDFDKESTYPHLWHALCNTLFLVYYEAHLSKYAEFDDRFVVESDIEKDTSGLCEMCAEEVKNAKEYSVVSLCRKCAKIFSK